MLDLSSFINIVVNTPSAGATSAQNFSLGLIVGQTTAITDRVKVYSSITEVLADGFNDNSALINAARLYFSQSPQPSQLAIGRQAPSGSATVAQMTADSATVTVNATAGMTVGDAITGTGIPAGTTIASVASDGITLTMSNPATAAATSGTITFTGETALEAFTACRKANYNWYMGYVVGAATADIEALAAYAESTTPATLLFYTTSDAAVKAGTTGNLCAVLQAAAYQRAIGQYSTYADAAVAIMGYACGSISESVDLYFKDEVGVTPDDLGTSVVQTLQNENCNYLETYNNSYVKFRSGVMANGSHFDDISGLDQLKSDIELSVADLIASSGKVPLTDTGMSQITTVVAAACAKAYSRGFIGAGVWAGPTVLNLATGTALANGYSVQVASVSSLTVAERSARQAPKIYVCIIRAESAESFYFAINVQ